jgi:hypothetical protein
MKAAISVLALSSTAWGVRESTDAPVSEMTLNNVVTDWVDALSEAIENCPISNHHAARLYGLTGEAMFLALQKYEDGSFPDFSDSDVASYAAHQIISYHYPQWQSAHLDPLLEAFVNRTLAPEVRKEIDSIVLPAVRGILTREASSGIANWVQFTPAPSTIGADAETLEEFQGKYQYTDPMYTSVTLNSETIDKNWQERGHFGTVDPYFKPLSAYVTGLYSGVVGSEEYDADLKEAQTKGSNDPSTKSDYEFATPYFWLFDMPHLPPTFLTIARSHLPEDLSPLETARFIAAFGLGIFEAANTNYGMKWGWVTGTTPLWRPLTAVRSGDTFGNEVDEDWTPQLTTPQHPEWPSGHCAHTGAATHALRMYLGGDDIDVVLGTDYQEVNDPDFPIDNRRYTTLTDVYEDVEDSRVFGGVHYRKSCKDANTLGKKAMEASFQYFGLPGAPAPGPSCSEDSDCTEGTLCHCTDKAGYRRLLFGNAASCECA